MVKYILKRLVQLVVVLLGVTFLTFMITQAAPSDAAEMKYVSMGMMPSSELLEKTREEMGLNDPVLIQYGRWLGADDQEIADDLEAGWGFSCCCDSDFFSFRCSFCG